MKTKELIRRSTLVGLAAIQLLFFPVYSNGVVSAEEAGESTTPTEQTTQEAPAEGDTTTTETEAPVVPEVPPEPPKAGPPPPGADSRIFTYDYNADTWESFLYSYDPVTRVKITKDVPTVRYNFETGTWEKLAWSFSAPAQAYFWYVVSTHATQPAGKVMGAVPQYGSQGSQGASYGGANTISNTGPGSTAGLHNTTNNSTGLEFNNTADFNIVLDLLAASGDASVLGNTTGGGATSGNASSTANVLNQIQSQWDMADILTFSSDLYGDIYGDLLVDTSNVGPDSKVEVDNKLNNNIDIDVNNDTTINNDINVVAESGDAKVSHNTTGGDATSGDANALVNIINMINSSIDSGASFLGTLNIHGEFDGDILFPEGTLENLISTTGPDSTVDINNEVNNDLDVEINNNTAIANNIKADASSGDATVAGNTTGGDATSGTATSSVTMLNLSGKDVVNENTLLVFINVLGSWVGVLMDAPQGTSAAAIGSGASVISNNAVNNDIDYTENNNASITNNVNAQAHSGDATVSGNTTGGDATSGDANSTVNIANLVGSDIKSNSWFGVLFINVFGSWNGSFGVDTEAGDHQNGGVSGASTGRGGQGGEGNLTNKPVQESDVKVYSFASTSGGGYRAVPVSSSSNDITGETEGSAGNEAILGTADATELVEQIAEETSSSSALVVGGTVLVLLGAVMFGNRLLMFISSRRS